MPDTILVTGYALKEGHGHYYFNAVVEATDDDCKESISARAYADYISRQNYGSWPPLDEVEIELGSVDYKYLHNPIQVKFCGTVRTYYESGRGAYPYPCNAQDKHPDSMIYTDPIAGTWFPSHELVSQGDYYTLKGW